MCVLSASALTVGTNSTLHMSSDALVAAPNVLRQSFALRMFGPSSMRIQQACPHHNRRLLDTSFSLVLMPQDVLIVFSMFTPVQCWALHHFCLERAFRVSPRVRFLDAHTRRLTHSHRWWCLLLPLLPLRSPGLHIFPFHNSLVSVGTSLLPSLRS